MENNERMVCEKAVLVGLNADCFKPEETATYETLEELEALLETAGGSCAAKVLQNRHAPDPHSFIGEGKAQELCELLQTTEANLVIFDNDLSPSQIRALEEITGVTVLDRSALILDIFAQRAKTAEGRLQVELAQYQYLLPKLSGMGKSMSRLGGGIGTRGPGETKLETDRRHIRRRIAALEQELKEMTLRRERRRERRKKDNVTTVAIVGYTNVGKSTLLNYLTGAGVLAEDKLFATLDPAARALELPDGRSVMLIDTVGLLRRLPHHLVEAFKSTLEEAACADLILNVCDISSPEMDQQLTVTRELLAELDAAETPVITVLNKCDLVEPNVELLGERTVKISARTGEGCDRLLEAVAAALQPSHVRMRLLIPYSDGEFLARLENSGKIFDRQFLPEGTLVDAGVSKLLLSRVQRYLYE